VGYREEAVAGGDGEATYAADIRSKGKIEGVADGHYHGRDGESGGFAQRQERGFLGLDLEDGEAAARIGGDAGGGVARGAV